MRCALLIIAFCGWMQALDLTVNSSFSTNEDQDLVFSYAEMLGKCTVSETPDRFRIVILEATGSISVASSVSGPWTPVVEGDYINPSEFVRFEPSDNVNGMRSMMSVRACLGAAVSAAESIRVAIAPIPDPITIATHPFVQPSGTKVTEDTPFTFTFADLATTLQVQDADGEPYKLVITAVRSGQLTTTTGGSISLPHDVSSGDSFRWQGAVNAYTKPDEGAIDAFTVKAVNTVAPFDATAVVTFATPIEGVVDDLSGVQTTLGSVDPLPVTRGLTTTFTYAELVALTHDSNDVDRSGTYRLSVTETAANGCLFRRFSTEGVLLHELDVFPGSIFIGNGETLQVFTPATMATGRITIGSIALSAPTATDYSAPVALRLHDPAGDGGSTPSSSGGGGGGGCGAGSALTSLLLACATLPLIRRRRHTPCPDAG